MKKCIICEEEEAEYCVKGMPNQCYCKECASEQFHDLASLQKLTDVPETASKAIEDIPLPEDTEKED